MEESLNQIELFLLKIFTVVTLELIKGCFPSAHFSGLG